MSNGGMTNKFKKPFRRKPLWSVDWSDYDPDIGASSGMAGNPLTAAKTTAAKSDPAKELALAHEKEPD